MAATTTSPPVKRDAMVELKDVRAVQPAPASLFICLAAGMAASLVFIVAVVANCARAGDWLFRVSGGPEEGRLLVRHGGVGDQAVADE